MPLPDPSSLFDSARLSRARVEMPTDLGTEELRQLGEDVLARSVFTARGTNAVFVSKLKEVIDELANGTLSEGQARAALWETLRALDYTPEGGFPGDLGEVPAAVQGTLQDLASFRRLDLIVSTQAQLMQGAGQQWRAMQPESLRSYPAFELVRVGPVRVARDWPARWRIAGFPEVAAKYAGAYRVAGAKSGMIGLVGDPRWGELGSYGNFADALGVDHAPFYFNSEMRWKLVPMARVLSEGITGPDGESPEEWITSGAVTLTGNLPKLPTPQISLKGVDPALIEQFKRSTGAKPLQGRPETLSFDVIMARDIARRNTKGGRL